MDDNNKFSYFRTCFVAKPNIKEAVVKIYTVSNSYNYHEPWQMWGQKIFNGSGCIISGNRILTNAHIVRDNTFIQVRRSGEAKRYTAETEMVSHESDLAILKVKDESFFDGIEPAEIGDLPEIKDEVIVYGFPEGGDKLSITEGVVSRIEHTKYSHSSTYLLICQIDAAINSGNSGGPVFNKDNKIIGVAFQGFLNGRYDNIGYMIPAPVIKHFFEDIKDGKNDGTPDIGLSMQKMENPDMRRKYLMTEKQTGVLIIKVYPDSPAEGILKPNDILLSIEGKNIENDGTIEFRQGERTYFGYLMQQKQINDLAEFKILRNGKIKEASVKLTKPIDYERLVPFERYEQSPAYYIRGGLVFETLTLNYLMEYGNEKDWHINAPKELINFYINGEPTREQREIVVLVKVLADEINVGYHDFVDAVIYSVNGVKISGIADLVDGFEKNKGEYDIIEDIHGSSMVLDREKANENGDNILKKYNIDSSKSKYLPH
ncbi:S1C family serine protease [Desulfobacterium sp. N47]